MFYDDRTCPRAEGEEEQPAQAPAEPIDEPNGNV